MLIKGQFTNRAGQTVTVRIVTQSDTTAAVTIGDGASGLWFPADGALVTESGLNDTFDVVIPSTATLRLEAAQYVADFYQQACRDAIVTVTIGEDVAFVGCVDPRQFSQDFSGGQLSNDIELNLIDGLAALQYANYAHVGEPGVIFRNVRAAASVRSFLGIITTIIRQTPGGASARLWYDGSKSLAADTARRYSVFSELGVAESVFIGEDEDDTSSLQDTLSDLLKFLNLHIVQRGHDFFIFSWDSFRADSIRWQRIDGTAGTLTTPNVPVAISDANIDGTQVDIDMGETFNRLVLHVSPDDMESVVTSPLDDDTISPMFRNRQKYATSLWAYGDGKTSRNAFLNLLQGKPTDYDGAHTDDYYLWVKKAYGWKLGTGDGKGGCTDWTTTRLNGGRTQHRIPGYLRSQIACALMAFGKLERKAEASDNSLTSSIDMTDYLVVSVNGNGKTAEDTMHPTPAEIKAAAPVAVWDGNEAGGVYSPSDDETKNYIVISGSIILNPILIQSVNFLNRGSTDDGTTITGDPAYTENIVAGRKDGKDTRRLAFRWWKADSPMTAPEPEDGKARYGATAALHPLDSRDKKFLQVGIIPYPTPANGWEGFYPWTDDDQQCFPFSFSAVGDKTDKVSKIGALECMLRIGDKVAVENKEFGDDNTRTVTVDGVETVVRYGSLENISWQTFKTLEECQKNHPGDNDAALDEYYRQTITIGFDPKIGDNLVGTKFNIQNNIDYTLGLDVEGMAIPVRHSDHLRGKVHFEILGPVFNCQTDVITRRHPTFFRHTQWTTQTVPLLSVVSSIMLPDLKIEIYSDNGLAGADTDSSHRFLSDTDERFTNKKDDLEFRIHSALTTAECEELGCANAVAPTAALDLTTGDAVLAIYDWLKAPDPTEDQPKPAPPVRVKAEQDYLDSYYTEYHVPRIELSFGLRGIAAHPWARFTHPALSGRTFFAESVEYDFQNASTSFKAKEE